MDIKFIYNNFFRNEVFGLDMSFQILKELFEQIAGDKIMLIDKYSLVYQQIRLIRSEIRTLKSMLPKIDSDFE